MVQYHNYSSKNLISWQSTKVKWCDTPLATFRYSNEMSTHQPAISIHSRTAKINDIWVRICTYIKPRSFSKSTHSQKDIIKDPSWHSVYPTYIQTFLNHLWIMLGFHFQSATCALKSTGLIYKPGSIFSHLHHAPALSIVMIKQ